MIKNDIVVCIQYNKYGKSPINESLVDDIKRVYNADNHTGECWFKDDGEGNTLIDYF